MAEITSARGAGELLDLEHLEVIRRIRRGDIVARKMGWNWIIDLEEVEKVRTKDWYTRLMAKRRREALT